MTLQATMSGRCNVYLLGLLTDGACRAKRFIAAWRVLVGVWMPKRLDMSASAVAQYTNPKKPPRSVWIDKAPQEKEITDFQLQPEPPVKARSARRPPSRRLIRHVLRARVEAANALAGFLNEIARTRKRVKASPHLAQGREWRDGAEVVAYLRARGARMRTAPLTDEWAASSDYEGYTTEE